MKKYFLVLCATLFSAITIHAEVKDSIPTQKVDVQVKVSTDTTGKALAESKKAADCKTCKTDKVQGLSWLLVFLPTLLFVGLLYYFTAWLKKDRYKLAEALSSCDKVALVTQTNDAQGNLTGSQSTEQLPRSSSRLIAFLTGITAMIIGVCLTTYYIYCTLADCPNPELDGLWKVIAALGIGVVPYGANMLKESRKDNN